MPLPPAATDDEFREVYDELKRIARRQLNRLRPGDTLGTTALVHEAYLKLARASVTPQDLGHFYALAARAMRQILVDAARERSSAKPGIGGGRVTLDEDGIRVETVADEMLAIDEGLARLEAVDARLARIVELRFFGGLTEEGVATALGVSARTVRRDWRKARAFLYREITGTTLTEEG
ncbi:MAG: ECF-type sigma factor [Gemmatimonadaceae bacterium]